MIQDTKLSHNPLILSNCFLGPRSENTAEKSSNYFRIRANIALTNIGTWTEKANFFWQCGIKVTNTEIGRLKKFRGKVNWHLKCFRN